jgi:hypothetical protein
LNSGLESDVKSIASPVESLGSVSKELPPIKVSQPSEVVALQGTDHPVSASSKSTKGCKFEPAPPRRTKNIRRPWEGPLPAPRISPKWCLGDALQKAKVRPPLPSCSSIVKGEVRRDRIGQRPSVEKFLMHARSLMKGEVRGEKVQKSNLKRVAIRMHSGSRARNGPRIQCAFILRAIPTCAGFGGSVC